MKRFPNESAEYRQARDRLLQSEIGLRDQVEAVARERRALPLGGRVPLDYVFDEMAPDGTLRQVRMSDLFSNGKNSLIVYSFMFGPKMERPCPSCTSIIDGLDASAPHVTQRTNLVVAAKFPIERIAAFARERGWDRIRLLSSSGSTYNKDYFGEDEKENQLPMANVFVRRDGAIHHFWGSELLWEGERHVDLLWPLWNLFDLTPEGRGTDWYPKLAYGEPVEAR